MKVEFQCQSINIASLFFLRPCPFTFSFGTRTFFVVEEIRFSFWENSLCTQSWTCHLDLLGWFRQLLIRLPFMDKDGPLGNIPRLRFQFYLVLIIPCCMHLESCICIDSFLRFHHLRTILRLRISNYQFQI